MGFGILGFFAWVSLFFGLSERKFWLLEFGWWWMMGRLFSSGCRAIFSFPGEIAGGGELVRLVG